MRKELALTPVQHQALVARKTPEGRLGFLGVRAAFVRLGKNLSNLSMAENGAPQLPEGFCSFSHSATFATAVFSTHRVGVDVEGYRPKITRIAQKFVHEKETFLNQLPAVEGLTRLWTAKEAIYKALNTAGVSLAEQIEVAPFSLEDTQGSAQVYLGQNRCRVQLQFSTFEQHELTIAHTLCYESIH
ncbi:MAG: 4'-phosphopantetheinyl transferase family protein [Flavobacteriaceae bacterium]